MLDTVSWSSYLLFVAASCGLYYAFFLLRFHRREIFRFLSRRGWRNIFTAAPQGGQQLEIEFHEVMGPPKASPGVSFHAAHEVTFGADEAPEVDIPGSQLVPEVLQEFREISEILETENGTKEDLRLLLEALRHRHPQLEHHPHLPSLLENLRDQLPFPLDLQELEELWHTAS